jgi:L-lactate dehydrogenase complex protein LldG
MVARVRPGAIVNARDEVLSRIRAALGADQADGSRTQQLGTGPAPDGSHEPHAIHEPRATQEPGTGPEPDGSHEPGDSGLPSATAYRTQGELAGDRLLDMLAERLADYRAAVRRATPADLQATLLAALAERGARRIVVPSGLDLPALPGTELIVDDDLSSHDLDALDGVITGAAVAIAQTGTIVLDGAPDQGRRAITLVPDYHLCIVHADQVVELVPEAVARLEPPAARPLTWISGPSATSDIELSRVEGVHGPRTLEVILVGPP